jgi:hypothetical protein
VQLNSRGAGFVKFPTQAGALFQWGERTAYHPSNPVGRPSNWVDYNTGNGGKFPNGWEASSMETCPSGYRRPTVIPAVSGVTSDSEIKQSLYTDINSSNDNNTPAWGYYADGWFDRLPIGTQSVTSNMKEDLLGRQNSAVGMDKEGVAYVGALVFNRNKTSTRYGAAIFFPAGGWRTTHFNDTNTLVDESNWEGNLERPGKQGDYWTSTRGTNDSGYMNSHGMTVYNPGGDKASFYSNYGTNVTSKMIRCVRLTR